MYKYSYAKNFDPQNKIVTQIGVEPSLIDSGFSTSLAFTDQLTADQKTGLDQVMADKGFVYLDMVQGGAENYLLAASPNGNVWKVSIDNFGILSTELL